MFMSHPSLTRQAVRYRYVTPVTHTVGGAVCTCHTRHSHSRRCVTYMSHPSLTRQVVRYVYVTPVTHMVGDALLICYTRHSHGMRCVTYMSHPSLTRQAVCYVYVTLVTRVRSRTICIRVRDCIKTEHCRVAFGHCFVHPKPYNVQPIRRSDCCLSLQGAVVL
jgi:hypothetical protein